MVLSSWQSRCESSPGSFDECRMAPSGHVGILLLYPWPHSLHQLIRHGRLHPEVIEERLWVFYSELLHQSGVMSIQPPPLLCQPWTGLTSFGSSPPLSFPGLLHISFKQVLLEDNNLEESNIIQGSILYSGCVGTDENARFRIILSGNIPAIFLIHLGHSCYIPSTF